MKKRLGFVTNSSSSSFICEACGNVESGWDMCISEANMCECENGHLMCYDHLDGFEPDEDLLDKRFRKEAEDKLIDCLKGACGEENKKKVNDYLKENKLTIKELVSKEIADIFDIFENEFEWEAAEEPSEYMSHEEFVDVYENASVLIKERCPICTHALVTEGQVLDYALKQLGVNYSELRELARQALIEKDSKKIVD